MVCPKLHRATIRRIFLVGIRGIGRVNRVAVPRSDSEVEDLDAEGIVVFC